MFQKKVLRYVYWLNAILLCVNGILLYKYIQNRYDLEDDNVFEEAVEYLIEKNSGIDIDLTP